MLSRIFWIGIAGLALVTGMILQDGVPFFWSGHQDVSAQTERAIEAGIERAVEGSVDRTQVVGPEGREVDVPPETRRALADAVGRLVKAEADLAVVKVRDGSDAERRAAEDLRDQARVEVETLKAAIEGQEQAPPSDRDAIRERIRAEIRETVREAVRN